MENTEKDTLVETFNYRGYSLPIYHNQDAQSFYTILDGKEVSFGSYNMNYEDDCRYLIDDKLDTIVKLDYGGKLSWFDNGVNGDRDIKLECRSRLVKVWLVKDPGVVNLTSIISEAKAINSYIESLPIRKISNCAVNSEQLVLEVDYTDNKKTDQ